MGQLEPLQKVGGATPRRVLQPPSLGGGMPLMSTPSRGHSLREPAADLGQVGGGCRLSLDIPAVLKSAGFDPDAQSRYIPGPRFASCRCWGDAQAR